MRYCNVRWTCVSSDVANFRIKQAENTFLCWRFRKIVLSAVFLLGNPPFQDIAPPGEPRPPRLICNFRWTPSLEDHVTGSSTPRSLYQTQVYSGRITAFMQRRDIIFRASRARLPRPCARPPLLRPSDVHCQSPAQRYRVSTQASD